MQKNVKLEDTNNNYTILTDKITYFKNKEEIFTYGKTKAFIEKNMSLHQMILNFLEMKKDFLQYKNQQ